MKQTALKHMYAEELNRYFSMLNIDRIAQPIRIQWAPTLTSRGYVRHFHGDNPAKIDRYALTIRPDVPSDDMAWLLAHEVRHIWQTVNGVLVFTNGRAWIWDGQSIQLDSIPYEDRPWEIDANRFAHHAIGRATFPNYLEPLV